MRVHEWVAEEKEYFSDEGLNYEFRNQLDAKKVKQQTFGDGVGAYQTFEQGRSSDVSSACHWTVNMAAGAGHGLMYGDAYSVAPCGIFVHPDSNIRKPEDLADVPISVGYQSGSHYSTIEALDMFLDPEQITLSFSEGLLFSRMEAAMIAEDAQLEDVHKYYSALRQAQADIDLHTHKYTKYYRNEFPERFHEKMDTRTFGPGERIVFEPYGDDVYEKTQKWVIERGIFPEGDPVTRTYKESIFT